jgi:hypothetical protein
VVKVPRDESLETMKAYLHDLEELKLIANLDIVDERRILRQKIAELEKKALRQRSLPVS